LEVKFFGSNDSEFVIYIPYFGDMKGCRWQVFNAVS